MAQVALSFALLAGAGLMLRSFYKLVMVDPGFNSQNVVSMLIQLNFTRYGNGAAPKVIAFHNHLLERVRANPGVISAAIARTFPLNESAPFTSGFQIEGRQNIPGQPKPTFDFRAVTPDYFEHAGRASGTRTIPFGARRAGSGESGGDQSGDGAALLGRGKSGESPAVG